jgi:hypothetical protein
MEGTMRSSRILAAGAAIVTLAAIPACDSTPTAPPDPPLLESIADPPSLPGEGDFVAAVDNPWFPLIPGTTYEYVADTEDGEETTVVEVTHDTRTILGITATVVRDRVYLEGELIEDTFDWFAQDSDGNVWYLGEDSCEIEDDECVSDDGSWEAGVDGARAGIVMWADPRAHVGEKYRQEFYEGVAEDAAKVIGLDGSVEVPHGSFDGCLETMDWNLLEVGHREHKFYCPGVGLVLEVSPRDGHQRNELVEVTAP